YLAAFLASTLGIAFDAAQFAAIPSLVGTGDLVTANGRIQASSSSAGVLGPPLAGFLLTRTSAEFTLTISAASFAVSGHALLPTSHSHDPPAQAPTQSSPDPRDIAEGLRYILERPDHHNTSLMMPPINFDASATGAELALIAKAPSGASDQQVSWLFAAV